MADERGVAERVYALADEPMTDEARAAIDGYLAGPPTESFGRVRPPPRCSGSTTRRCLPGSAPTPNTLPQLITPVSGASTSSDIPCSGGISVAKLCRSSTVAISLPLNMSDTTAPGGRCSERTCLRSAPGRRLRTVSWNRPSSLELEHQHSMPRCDTYGRCRLSARRDPVVRAHLKMACNWRMKLVSYGELLRNGAVEVCAPAAFRGGLTACGLMPIRSCAPRLIHRVSPSPPIRRPGTTGSVNSPTRSHPESANTTRAAAR